MAGGIRLGEAEHRFIRSRCEFKMAEIDPLIMDQNTIAILKKTSIQENGYNAL